MIVKNKSAFRFKYSLLRGEVQQKSFFKTKNARDFNFWVYDNQYQKKKKKKKRKMQKIVQFAYLIGGHLGVLVSDFKRAKKLKNLWN